MINPIEKLNEFLVESNAIEGVHDDVSFTQAIRAWEYLMSVNHFTTGVVLKTHKILMLHQPLYPNEKGYFRNVQVMIAGRFGMNPINVPQAIDQWVLNVLDVIENGRNESEIFLERITREHHVLYEKIHPFVDGNGRTGRMFLNYERLKVGLPLLVIKADERQEYYKWFKQL